MKKPLLYRVYKSLRRGWKQMTPEAQRAVQAFVASQKTAHGYVNAAGHEDAYYRQFGEVLEAVFTPSKLLHMKIHLSVPESRNKDTVYGRFFDFLEREMRMMRPREIAVNVPKVMTTNALCCVLAMQYQTGRQLDAANVEWLQNRQDETGGFHASEEAPVPDLLSTAVALFTLRLIKAEYKDASQFIQAHWVDNGGFTPTVFDDYSDVEYVFYGLLALGAK